MKDYAVSYRDTKIALLALTDLAASQGGYFTARQAKLSGYDASHLSYHNSARNFERVGHGLYRIPTLPISEHDDLVRAWFWSRGRDDRPRGVISHQTALSLHELAEFIPSTIHLTVPRGFRKEPPAGCVVHRSAIVDGEWQWIDSVPVTTPVRTLSDLAQPGLMPMEQFAAALEAAVARGFIRLADAERLRGRGVGARRPASRGDSQ